MASKAMGTKAQGDTYVVTVRHGGRDSYSRSVMPAARRNLKRLYPHYAFELVRGEIDDARPVGDEWDTDWVFRRTYVRRV